MVRSRVMRGSRSHRPSLRTSARPSWCSSISEPVRRSCNGKPKIHGARRNRSRKVMLLCSLSRAFRLLMVYFPLISAPLAWIYASASVLIISLCGLVGVAMVPLAKSIAYDDILRFLIGLGVGTLCGDALMHLLPHALLPHGEEEHDHEAHGEDHDHSAESRAVWLCLCCFGAAFFMYSLEMILPLFRDGNSTHGHSHGPSAQSNRVDPQQPASSGQPHHHHHHQHQSSDDIELDHGELSKEREANTMLAKKGGAKPMAAVAFMVILGDGLHNITDGLAIGGAFAIDPVMGLATSFAILCHELPHELGDFALLLQTGVSIRRAIFLNIVSSVLSFIGE